MGELGGAEYLLEEAGVHGLHGGELPGGGLGWGLKKILGPGLNWWSKLFGERCLKLILPKRQHELVGERELGEEVVLHAYLVGLLEVHLGVPLDLERVEQEFERLAHAELDHLLLGLLQSLELLDEQFEDLDQVRGAVHELELLLHQGLVVQAQVVDDGHDDGLDLAQLLVFVVARGAVQRAVLAVLVVVLRDARKRARGELLELGGRRRLVAGGGRLRLGLVQEVERVL